MSTPDEPTGEQCSNREQVSPGMWAVWYPQMGGYVGKAVVEPMGGCFDVWIWHDGEFPFSEGGDGVSPAHLHHCDADQFVRFGEAVGSLPGMKDET